MHTRSHTHMHTRTHTHTRCAQPRASRARTRDSESSSNMLTTLVASVASLASLVSWGPGHFDIPTPDRPRTPDPRKWPFLDPFSDPTFWGPWTKTHIGSTRGRQKGDPFWDRKRSKKWPHPGKTAKKGGLKIGVTFWDATISLMRFWSSETDTCFGQAPSTRSCIDY